MTRISHIVEQETTSDFLMAQESPNENLVNLLTILGFTETVLDGGKGWIRESAFTGDKRAIKVVPLPMDLGYYKITVESRGKRLADTEPRSNFWTRVSTTEKIANLMPRLVKAVDSKSADNIGITLYRMRFA